MERRRLREAGIERFRLVLSGREDVVRVILFESTARGRIAARSDVDLVVVQRTERRFLDRLDEGHFPVLVLHEAGAALERLPRLGHRLALRRVRGGDRRGPAPVASPAGSPAVDD
ncbi:MAG: hypothetical protein JXB32_14580 [Deltaproteobacteria bacterium]|nr:hypothetical protein [Deltaproteobacteria bacterium]